MIELTPDVRREFERLHKRLDEIEENFGHDWNAMADLIHEGFYQRWKQVLVSPRELRDLIDDALERERKAWAGLNAEEGLDRAIDIVDLVVAELEGEGVKA